MKHGATVKAESENGRASKYSREETFIYIRLFLVLNFQAIYSSSPLYQPAIHEGLSVVVQRWVVDEAMVEMALVSSWPAGFENQIFWKRFDLHWLLCQSTMDY